MLLVEDEVMIRMMVVERARPHRSGRPGKRACLSQLPRFAVRPENRELLDAGFAELQRPAAPIYVAACPRGSRCWNSCHFIPLL